MTASQHQTTISPTLTQDGHGHIVVSGASGLVGSRLVPFLESHGYRVSRLVRNRPAGKGEIAWDPTAGTIDAAALEGASAVIHLSGASIAGGLWTAKRKQVIRESRIASTGLLARTLASLAQPPSVLVSTSAVGFYGDAGDRALNESAGKGEGFLADVCRDWEAAAEPARQAGIRVVHPRLGVVMAREGGMLPLVARVFKLGLGGPLGSGRQYFPWIAIDDLVAVLELAVSDARLSGPVNAVAPEQTTNRMFTSALAHAVHRPAFMPAPAPIVKLIGGELAQSLILSSQRVIPDRLGQVDFTFVYPTIDRALTAEMSRSSRQDG